ncbi:MAG: 16S rRNA (cytosine(967)-C(5))-methyltransferase RsmB [Candidatus Hydrogenedentales bacterium]|jgi:16S rRNA (cytosine967-C5)-methyltransferase
MTAAVDPVRLAAVDVLLRVFEHGAFLSDALDQTLQKSGLSERGRRFLTQLVYGTVRHRALCDVAISRILDQPMDKLPRPILAVLRMGVFQALFCDQVTFPSMVHTSVSLARKRGHAGTARLANAVLRRAPRTIDEIKLPPREKGLSRHLGFRYSMPKWLVEQWIEEYGAEPAEKLCAACNEQAPTTIRVNTTKCTVKQLTKYLTHAELLVEKVTRIPEELTVLKGSALKSKHFLQGQYMLQDPGSMLAAHLMQPVAGEWVLDVCSAPGGKTTHLAQLADSQLNIVAADGHPERLAMVRENVERLGLSGIRMVAADGRIAPYARRFDGVLLDAPCTGYGTFRRHPDLKWRAQPEDAARMAPVQRDLLRSAVDLCENGGRIVYSVCTFTRDETLDVRAFAESSLPVVLEDGPEWLNPWKISTGTYRTLPHADNMDGFFLMRLRKAS